MRTAAGLGLLFLWLAAVQAHAQTAASTEPAQSPLAGLPTDPEPSTGVVPGIGATAGVVLTAISPVTKCSRDAARAADGLMTPSDALVTCNEAIAGAGLTNHDLASTLVNRGVLMMVMQAPQDAKADFNRALALEPTLAEALVNRGAILLNEGKPREAVADLDRGIALQPEHPERAYYHRALAREDLKDFSGAYADYKAAEAIKPGWEPVTVELRRFHVRPAAQGK
jgi:tetratricopeptide (TPR) repeat protein